MAMTRDDMERVIGPLDDQLAAEIAYTDASPQELAEAMAWLNQDEALVNEGKHMPRGKVGELIAILAPPENEDGPAPTTGSQLF